MVTVQFKTKIKNGVIQVPKKYQGKLHANVRVILKTESPKSKTKNYLDKLLAHPVKVKNSHPMTREKLYARQSIIAFIDTNIWLYALLDTGESEKSSRAKELLAQIEPILSLQVFNEICVNLIKKAGFTEEQITQLIEAIYEKYPVVEIDENILLTASQLRQEYAFSFWDNMVVAYALAANAEILYSEDMQNGLIIRGNLEIKNPLV